jgi:Mrp family chromosome partitioning ATPase
MSDKNKLAVLQPTAFTEINRIHRQALSAKRGSLVVTAATTGEGTSTFAHIMALRSADNGQKTLLVDLNMRDTHLSSSFGFERHAWRLPERQINEPLLDLVEPVEGVANLYFMAAPRDDVSVQYLRDVTRANYFLTNLERHFDHIVIDTTPINAYNRYNVDPVLMAAAATRTVLVMLAGHTPREKVKKAREMLEDAGATIEGLLVNDYKNPSLRDEMLKFAGSLERLSPDFSSWLRKKILDAETL